MPADETGINDVVDVRNLVKVYHDFWRRPKVRAVDGINLSVPRGEIFGMLGPNGSGKSTTLKILLGLLHASSGTVRVLGRSPRDVETKRAIGYLPEESYLYPYLTPRETLDFYARLFDLDASARTRRCRQLLDMVGLSAAANRRVGEFSKGMARRLGLAQALINDPDLLVLDEPTSGLDPLGCRQIKDLLLALAARGKTIILSSHLLADVEDVCARIAILYNGRIRASGRVDTLLRRRDRLTFTLPALTPERMEAVLNAVREKTGQQPDVEHPTVTLEEFFLEIIAQAQAPTPGGTTIAPYLSGGEN